MGERKAYIYSIINIKNGKQYVGATIHIRGREKTHFSKLKDDKHCNNHLQNSYNKYGKSNFRFVVIEETVADKVYEREEYWVEELNSFYDGYNQTSGGKGIGCGEGHPLYGKHFSKEHKEKLSEAHKGKHLSKEHKEKISENHASVSGKNNPMYGKHHTKETKEKISEARKDMHLSQETKDKMSKNLRKLTKERGVEIREKYLDKNITYSNLADEYDISYGMAHAVVNCNHWSTKHLKEE